jgi:hypothetical protein
MLMAHIGFAVIVLEILYLGKWRVGGFHYDSCRSREDPKKWEATCKLPGLKQSQGHFAEEKEAREAAEKAVKHWLSGLPSNVALEGRGD